MIDTDVARNLIVVADDLGLSPGVNRAVRDAFQQGGLTHASISVTSMHFKDALENVLPTCPGLCVGLHLNLLSGQVASPPGEVPLLADGQGRMNRGILDFWRLCRQHDGTAFRAQLRREIEAQIVRAQAAGLHLTHLDGHQHCHALPAVNEIVHELAAARGIPRVRAINERLLTSLRMGRSVRRLSGLSLLRYAILRCILCWRREGVGLYFYSVLYSCRLGEGDVPRFIPEGCDGIELMVHPGRPDLDKTEPIDRECDRRHLVSPHRTGELRLCMALKEAGGR
jgi:predicted glycoside hydrolase/deacetylase ChbG (UPF0249 family)